MLCKRVGSTIYAQRQITFVHTERYQTTVRCINFFFKIVGRPLGDLRRDSSFRINNMIGRISFFIQIEYIDINLVINGLFVCQIPTYIIKKHRYTIYITKDTCFISIIKSKRTLTRSTIIINKIGQVCRYFPRNNRTVILFIYRQSIRRKFSFR